MHGDIIVLRQTEELEIRQEESKEKKTKYLIKFKKKHQNVLQVANTRDTVSKAGQQRTSRGRRKRFELENMRNGSPVDSG